MLKQLPEGFEVKMKFTLSPIDQESGEVPQEYLTVDESGACVVSPSERRVFIEYYFDGLYIICSDDGTPLHVKSPVEVAGVGSVNKILLCADPNDKYSLINFYMSGGGDKMWWQKKADSTTKGWLGETTISGKDGDKVVVIESKNKDKAQVFSKVELTSYAVAGSMFFKGQDMSKPDALDASYVVFAKNTIFSGNKLPGINFDHAILNNARFDDSVLKGASFVETNCDNSDFRNCDLSNARFETVYLDTCKFDKRTVFDGAIFKDSPFYVLNLKGFNFQKVNIIGGSFYESKLEGAKFNGASLNNVLLLGADLTNCDFSNALLENMDFTFEMELAPQTINWKGASFKNCNFKKVSLKNVNFENCYFENCDFTKATLKSTSFIGATIFGCNLTNCDLTNLIIGEGDNKVRFYAGNLSDYDKSSPKTILNEAIFDYSLIAGDWSLLNFKGSSMQGDIPMDLTNLKGACTVFEAGFDLNGRTIENANFRYSEIVEVDLRNSRSTGDLGPDFSDANLSKCNFKGSILKRAKFELANLEVGILSYSNLSYSDFTGAVIGGDSEQRSADLEYSVLENVNFQGAFLAGVSLKGCTLTGSNLAESIIYLANFEGAYLVASNFSNIKDGLCQGVNFSGACLVNANFTGTTATNYKGKPTDFDKACLQGTNFEDANLIGVNLEDAGVDFNNGEFLVIVTYPEDEGRPDREEYIPYTGTVINANKTNDQTICPNGSAGACKDSEQYKSKNAPTSFIWYRN